MNERDIFIAVLQKEAQAERQAYLEEACAGDAELRRGVEALLKAHDRAGSFLESPALARFSATGEPVCEGPGTVLGPYQLREPLGEGGFGIVFLAEQQQPLRRQVALKVLKPGMDTRQVIARFEAERQALALMDHPHIARVLDAGETAGGRPYFVMELVRGAPITDYCDQHRLAPRERLELFLAVCQAVQHAHHKGIIHRDLKPSNVLVTPQDGPPVVKVIDFGIAKALGSPLTATPLTTGFAQMIGTPLYMSPEQVEQTSLDVDTRSDIYSLGVLLYELLAGTTPFDPARLNRVGPDEWRRIIREEEPPRPSTRITTLGQAATTVSARRRSDPRRLRQLFRGELDWIVMKALEKDRNRRYETVSAFAADVQRYLNDEPVQACPPSGWYRLRKWTRRHQPVVAAAGAVLLIGVIAWAVSTVLIVRQRDEARAQRTLAQEQRELAQEQRELAQAQRTVAQEQREQARRAVDEMYTEVAEQWLAHQPHLQDLQRRFLLKALHYYEAFAQEQGADPALRHQAGVAYRRVGDIQSRLGKHAHAEAAYGQAVHLQAALAAAFPARPEYRRELAASLYNLGALLVDCGRRAEAEEAYRRALPVREQLAADFPAESHYRWDLAKSHNNLGILLEQTGRPQEAEQAYRQAIALQEKLVAEVPASPGYRQELAKSYNNLAVLLTTLNRLPEAEQAYHQALDVQEKLAAAFAAGPEYQHELAGTRNNLALLLWLTGRLPDAEQALRQAAAVREKLAAEFPAVTDYRVNLARGHYNLASVLADAGRPNEAEQACRRAVAVFEKLVAESPGVPPLQDELAKSHCQLGSLLEKARRPHEAARVYHQAVGWARQAVEGAPQVGPYRRTLGVAHHRAGEWQAAVQALHEAVELGAGDVLAWFYLALAHGQLGEKDQARPWYDRAGAVMDESTFTSPRFVALRAEAAALLGLAPPPGRDARR
jgi:serine/threonine protein kinase/tetratricopeptide (TPR) repeat protein